MPQVSAAARKNGRSTTARPSTLSTDLAVIAAQAQPKLLVTTHRIYHMNIQDNTRHLQAQMDVRCAAILEEIRQAGYDGKVVNGQDLDVFPV